MKGNLSRLALCLIFAVALILRLVALGRYPAGFTADEAAQGYMAYSILKTGKDEWGVRLPLAPRSFGDFKPPLQTYLMIPSIAVFGLNEFAVRLPSAILGILGVLGVYLLASELFRMKIVRINPNNLSLLSSLLLAISPWHISLSRGAFEANLTTFFLPLGFYFFLRGISKPK
jgi:4-amino-4-deoxy-L-arabinose transferase-like glycosyltransferase